MPILLIIIISILGSLILIGLIFFLIVEVGYKKMFPHRGDGVNSIRYFHRSEFNLSYKKIYIPVNKYRVSSYLYSDKSIKSFKALIVVSHGIGFGHNYLLPLVKELCKDGYLVLAFDQLASGTSEGLRVKGMVEGPLALYHVVNYVKSNDELKNYPLYLMGHSWGAYSCLASLNVLDNVDKVVAFAGFNSEFDLFSSYLKPITFLKPFFYLHNLINYGKLGNLKVVDALNKTNAKVLYIQGEADRVVPSKISLDKYSKVKRDNITIKVLPHKGHSSFFAFDSETNQGKLLSKFGLLGGVDKDYRNFIDFRKMSELDPDVYSIVKSFLD